MTQQTSVQNSGAQDIWTVKDILDWCQGYLERNNDPQPLLSAQWLLSEVMGLSRVDLYTHFDQPLSPDERATMRAWVQRRAKGEPLQLISGKAPFRYITVLVEKGVLIPRPETEVLVSECLQELHLDSVSSHVVATEDGEVIQEAALQEISVLDLCTGSGCIACSIASEYPAARVIATDIAPEALALAAKNVHELALDNRVTVMESDLCGALLPHYAESFDLVISNPPYVPTSVVAGLSDEVTQYDPTLALDGGPDGLDVFRAFVADAYTCLRAGGVLGVELFEESLEEAATLAQAAGFNECTIVPDLTGRNRVLIAHK